MKGSGMWMSRRQVRWLVILLALLPLVPAILMVRLMLDNAQRDRDEAVEVETRVYRDQLIHLVNRTSQNSSAGGGGEALFAQLRRIFGDGVTVVLRAPEGGGIWKWGDEPTEDAIVAVIPEGRYAGWTVVLDRVVDLPDYIGEQMRHAWWRAAAWALGVAMVAGVAWFAVHRGLRVDELRSDLLTTVSHEIKTPLASMRVLLETLTDDDAGIVANEEKRREYLDLMLRENWRLTRLADDFLTFARLERGDHRLRREICDVGRIVQIVIEELSPAIEAAGARIGIGIGVSAPLMAWGDADALAAVVRNLLENALKYGAAGDEPPRIVISTAESGRRHLILTVSDDGPGIAPEFRRAVFRRYFRIDSRLAGGGSGVGLGLAICRHLTRKMRGRITVEPNSGGGCRFVVRLARAEGVAGAATAPLPVPIPIRP